MCGQDRQAGRQARGWQRIAETERGDLGPSQRVEEHSSMQRLHVHAAGLCALHIDEMRARDV